MSEQYFSINLFRGSIDSRVSLYSLSVKSSPKKISFLLNHNKISSYGVDSSSFFNFLISGKTSLKVFKIELFIKVKDI